MRQKTNVTKDLARKEGESIAFAPIVWKVEEKTFNDCWRVELPYTYSLYEKKEDAEAYIAYLKRERPIFGERASLIAQIFDYEYKGAIVTAIRFN